MATRLQVTCISRLPGYYARHERIRAIGGSGWSHPEDQAISHIENGVYSYFVRAGTATVEVIVATYLGHKYLMTDRDTSTRDNLLDLPTLP